MRETQRRLAALGLFESVSVEIVGTDQPAAVPTRITVKEADLNQISYSFGYGTEEQLNADAQWRHLNFVGGGRTASVRVRWSSIDRGGEGAFVQPFFLMPRLSLQLTGHAWQLDEPSYEAWFSGGGASVSFARGAHDRWEVGYLQEFERSRLSDGLLGDATSAPERDGLGVDSSDGTQSGMLAQLAVGYSRDTTVDLLNPRRGYRASARMEKAGGWLPGRFAYYNVLTTGRYYRGLRRLTVAGRVQAGFITARDGSPLPFAKRYFLGGADSLRGWGRLEVSPLSQAGAPIGGSSTLLVSAELRVPAVPRVMAVLFADAGNVWADPWEIHLDDLRVDMGAGVRIASPFGPLRLDIGYQLTPITGLRVDGDPHGRRWRLHFSTGQSF
jgi:outer membrane protein insertion porin family